MKLKYVRSINVAPFFFKRNICKGTEIQAGGLPTEVIRSCREKSSRESLAALGVSLPGTLRPCSLAPPVHTPLAICPETMIKPMKALQISQKFYDYAD